ncbi:origin recognition complex subunit 5-like [Halichondria panicea]|uniref:origin recognition complex subunit 5-like n=1 Tax=Halichondria panicea TaxID=6063 RepID=UPI00312B8951
MSAVRRNTRSKSSSSKAEITTDTDSSPSKKKTPSKRKPSDVRRFTFTSPQKMDTSLSEVKVQSSMSVDDFVVGCGEGVWSSYKELCQRLPGRQSQVELLLTLCGEPSSPTPSPLYLYGNTGTGKTLTIKTVLDILKAPHVLVNCVECYNSKVLFSTILNRAVGVVNGMEPVGKCDSLYGFVQELKRLASELSQQTLYIVLDKAERLRSLEVTVLSALLRLREISGCEVCVVMVSILPYEKLTTDSCPSQLLSVHFPDYSRDETLAIMALDRNPQDSPEFFATFSNHIWNVFHIVCRDLAELRHLSAVLYPKYSEPVNSGEINSRETRRLWKHIEPFFKDVMSRIYLRELSTQQGERALATPTEGSGSVTDYLELPYYSKYLLFSSFLASYNPARADRKFFSKTKQPKTRKSHRPATKEKPNHQLLGPKPFPLDRLMAIFYSILEEDVPPAAHLYSQVASLVTLQLLAQISTGDPLDSPKYKCLLTLDHIRLVARSVGFDIVQYLYDFN